MVQVIIITIGLLMFKKFQVSPSRQIYI
jgi:hypothetical protein